MSTIKAEIGRSVAIVYFVIIVVTCAETKRTPVRLDGVQKSKTAEKNKGILVKDPFLESSHFWPLDQKKIIAVTDLQTGHNGILMNGSTIKKDNEINLPYATTEHPGSYIILGDFNGTCFSNPGKCILGGLTLSFWANLQRDHVHDVQDAYIISGGGQSKESRGFAFLFFHGTYVFIISTADKQWKLTIDEANVPTKKWANFAFVWNRNGELAYYLNGKKQNSTKSKATERPKDDYPLITVGKPNNADGKDYMYPLRIHSIAMWDRPLKPDQIKSIYDSLKAMEEESKLRKRFKVART
eukprot:gene16637-18327_t